MKTGSADKHDKTVVEGSTGGRGRGKGGVGCGLLGNSRVPLGSSVPLGLRVDGGHVAQAALEAAHREEDALLRAGGELATRASLQLLAQAEACDRTGQHGQVEGSGPRQTGPAGG